MGRQTACEELLSPDLNLAYRKVCSNQTQELNVLQSYLILPPVPVE